MVRGIDLDICENEKEEDPYSSYIVVSYNGERLGRLKNLVQGFDDYQHFSDKLTKWAEKRTNVNDELICRTLSKHYSKY